MKKAACYLLILFFLCTLLCGCSSWRDGYYESVEPHKEQNTQQEQQTVSVTNYSELRDALEEIVNRGKSSDIISVADFSQGDVSAAMEMAVDYVCNRTPIGAYAVQELTYELGMNAGKPALAVNIVYNHTRSEILRIKKTSNMEEVIDLITLALNTCDAGIVLQTELYNTVDLQQIVEDYSLENPNQVMEIPQVSVSLYPESGMKRVIEVTFSYQNSRDDLRYMQGIVRPMFSSAQLYVSADTHERQKYAQLYAFLMERFDSYTVETSITPTYSLLQHGVGDNKAFAVLFSAICRGAGLECEIISGTRAGEAWYWNFICIEDVYYHVDLLRCHEEEGFQTRLDAEMTDYVWDYSAYEPSVLPEEPSEPPEETPGNEAIPDESQSDELPDDPAEQENSAQDGASEDANQSPDNAA